METSSLATLLRKVMSSSYQEICRQAALDNIKKVAPALSNFFSRACFKTFPCSLEMSTEISKSSGVLPGHHKDLYLAILCSLPEFQKSSVFCGVNLPISS